MAGEAGEALVGEKTGGLERSRYSHHLNSMMALMADFLGCSNMLEESFDKVGSACIVSSSKRDSLLVDN